MSSHPFFVCGPYNAVRILCCTRAAISLNKRDLGRGGENVLRHERLHAIWSKRITREVFRQLALSNVDCVVRLSKPVNSKQGPATTAALKTHMRAEMLQLFQAQH